MDGEFDAQLGMQVKKQKNAAWVQHAGKFIGLDGLRELNLSLVGEGLCCHKRQTTHQRYEL